MLSSWFQKTNALINPKFQQNILQISWTLLKGIYQAISYHILASEGHVNLLAFGKVLND